MAKVSLIFYSIDANKSYPNGFAGSAEEMFKMAFGVDPETLDQSVVAEINKTGTLYYSRRTDVRNGIQYQSTLELLKSELIELGELCPQQ